MATSCGHTSLLDRQFLPVDLPETVPVGQLPDDGKEPQTEGNATQIDWPPLLDLRAILCKYT